MDFNGFEALHADGHERTACILFAQMCREALYGSHDVPATVSHLVHYTTLGTVTSMLGVGGAAAEKCRLATRSPKGVAEEGIVTLIVLSRKGPHGFPFRRPHSRFPIQ